MNSQNSNLTHASSIRVTYVSSE